MSIINRINEFSKEKDKFSYSFLFHSTTSEELIDIIKKKLDNINKKMNNAFKKKNINDRIFSLITDLENKFQPTENVNGIYFVNKKVNFLEFSKENMKHINSWNITKFFMDYDECFMTTYFSGLFSLDSIKTVFKFDKNSYEVIKLDVTKSKNIESHSSMDESNIMENISKHKPVLIYGINPILKKLKLDNIFHQNMNREEICDIISKKEIEENMIVFKSEILDQISNESVSDKFIFGRKDISIAIENYMVKKLFINSKLLNLLKSKADNSLLNFSIMEIKSLETGDPGYILNKDYSGMVAVKYY